VLRFIETSVPKERPPAWRRTLTRRIRGIRAALFRLLNRLFRLCGLRSVAPDPTRLFVSHDISSHSSPVDRHGPEFGSDISRGAALEAGARPSSTDTGD
jgi:hypothetical protein